MQSDEYEKQLIANRNMLAALTVHSIVRRADISKRGTVVSLLGSVLSPVEHGLSDAGGFARGVGEGAWDGVKGTVSGVGHLAEDGYKLATDSHYREQAWNSALNDAKASANFAATAVTDPGEAADEVGVTARHAWQALETAYNQAAARGQGSEFIGQIFGQGAILAGTAVIPGGVEADAVEGIGDAGRAATLLGDAGKLTDAAETAGRTGAAAEAVGSAIEDGEEVASSGESAAKTVARGEPYAFGTGTRSERAAAIIDRSAQALGRSDASGLVDNVVYDAAAGSPSFWVDPTTGERTITLDAATFGKTEAGQLIAGTHELVHAEQWQRVLSRNASNLAAAHSAYFGGSYQDYAIREVLAERRALQSVDRLLGGLTPQQLGHSKRYIEGW